MGVDFLTVQRELEPHFWGLLLAACLLICGIAAFVWDFARHGRPVGELTRGDAGGEAT